jgi:hypothetical protein
MIIPCMKSTSALDGGLRDPAAVASAFERVLLDVPGAPGWTIVGVCPAAGAYAGCCGQARAMHRTIPAAALNRSEG